MNNQVPSRRDMRVMTVAETLADVDRQLQSAVTNEVRSIATGFGILDEVLGGGTHVGELLLLGGPPGVGKTILALQMARNMARSGTRVVFACYEHEPAILLARLLALEAGDAGHEQGLSRSITQALNGVTGEATSLAEILGVTPAGAAALDAVQRYASNLIFVQASGSRTTIDELRKLVVDEVNGRRSALFVDYLQKLPVHPEPDTEAEKVTRAVEALKDLAMEQQLPVVLLSAVDADGLRASRLRLYHLRGSSAIAFESDVVLMMNDKQRAVSKVHLTYDAPKARSFGNWVVVSVEKNRGGPNLVDLEFRKDFPHFRFDPDGGMVSEQLVSERLDEANL